MRKIVLMLPIFWVMITYAQLSEAKEKSVTMQISGMSCGTCSISIRYRVMQMKGVYAVVVDIDAASATVAYDDSQQSPSGIADAITKLGYPTRISGL
ncbi:MAG: heavy metal-associated domain-containing protein [Ghiorsea sp.]